MTKPIAKVVRDGKVAVLVSRGFGAGWYTWNTEHKDMLFSPVIVEMIEEKRDGDEIEAKAKELWPDAYLGGLSGLTIKWVPQGTAFEIGEYDGAELLRIRDQQDWMIA